MTAKFPVKLGARVFRFLYENFLFHDFSLQNFARGLQVLILLFEQMRMKTIFLVENCQLIFPTSILKILRFLILINL